MDIPYKHEKTFKTGGNPTTGLLNKKLTTEAYLKAKLFAQLHETESLHAISDALLDEHFQEALRFESISASQLSRKNNEVDPAILATIFLDLVGQIQSH